MKKANRSKKDELRPEYRSQTAYRSPFSCAEQALVPSLALELT